MSTTNELERNEKKETKEQKRDIGFKFFRTILGFEFFGTIWSILLLVVIAALGGIISLWATESLWTPIVEIVPLIAPITVYAISLILSLASGAVLINSSKFIVQHQQRAVVERWGGKYWKTLGPGMHFLLPYLMSVRAVTSTWDQSIQLFLEERKEGEEEKKERIDTEDGTVVTPEKMFVFFRIYKPDEPYLLDKIVDSDLEEKEEMNGVYRSIYLTKDWRENVQSFTENALRAAINKKTLEDILTFSHSSDVLQLLEEKSEEEDKEGEETRRTRLERSLRQYGIQVIKVTCADFTPAPDAAKIRQRKYNADGEIVIATKEIEVAAKNAEAKAKKTMGTLIEAIAQQTGLGVGTVQAKIKKDDKLRNKLLQFVREFELADRKAFLEVRGGSKGSPTDAATTALLLQQIGSNPKKGKKDKNDDEDNDD